MKNVIGALRQRIFSSGATEGKNIIAFSGGVDSSLVAALVHQTFPNNSLACVGVSSALPSAQLHLARSVASHIGECFRRILFYDRRYLMFMYYSKVSNIRRRAGA